MRPRIHFPAARAAARAAACAAALLLAAACAPDAGVVGPVAPPAPGGGDVLDAALADPACEDLRAAAEAVLEITGVDPFCVEPEARPLLWRTHFGDVDAPCGCLRRTLAADGTPAPAR